MQILWLCDCWKGCWPLIQKTGQQLKRFVIILQECTKYSLFVLVDSKCFGFVFFQALADPYFKGLAKVEREPSCQPISKMEFEFERRRVTKEDIRELIFREILEYHPQLLKDYMNGTERTNFLYPRLYLSWLMLFSFDLVELSS